MPPGALDSDPGGITYFAVRMALFRLNDGLKSAHCSVIFQTELIFSDKQEPLGGVHGEKKF
jgi:hypothetical protein